jgi:hypothetical protein
MPSADFGQPIPTPIDVSSSRQADRPPPGNALPPSRLCPPHLLPRFPYRYRTSRILAFSSSVNTSYPVSVRRASALPAASLRSYLAIGTLAVQLTLPPVERVEDFQVSAPSWAHQQKKGQPERLPLIIGPKTLMSRKQWSFQSVMSLEFRGTHEIQGTGLAIGYLINTLRDLVPAAFAF